MLCLQEGNTAAVTQAFTSSRAAWKHTQRMQSDSTLLACFVRLCAQARFLDGRKLKDLAAELRDTVTVQEQQGPSRQQKWSST